MRDVLVSVPTRGAIQWATVTRLQEVRDANPGLPPIIYQPGNLSVAQTRNKIVRTFLEGRWKVLAMVDDDVIPSPHFLDMRKHLDEYGLVCLPHPMPMQSDPSRLVLGVFEKTDTGYRAQEIEAGIQECDAVATGCFLVSREAVEALGSAPFHIEDDPSAEITSDDFIFCEDLKDAGFKIGYWWDGWFADHHSITSLAPLLEARTNVLA